MHHPRQAALDARHHEPHRNVASQLFEAYFVQRRAQLPPALGEGSRAAVAVDRCTNPAVAPTAMYTLKPRRP
jgi:hypothetical protein